MTGEASLSKRCLNPGGVKLIRRSIIAVSPTRLIIPAARLPVVYRTKLSRHQSLYVGSVHPPQTHGNVQSAMRLALSGRYLLQTEALIGLMDLQTTSNVPVASSLPIIAGLDRWWLVFIITSNPLGARRRWPYMAWRTALTSAVPAWLTACAHIRKPMRVASIASFVVLSRCWLKSDHILMNASFSADLTDWK